MKLLRGLYDWVLKWASTPYGGIALFLLAFAESSVFPIPPDVLLIALCLGNRNRWLWFASVCTVGSVLGAAAGYLIGLGLWSAVDQLFFTYIPGFSPDKFEYVTELYERWNFWIVFVAAFTPIPYKVITITAGVCAINFPMFLIASIVGRAARFVLVSYLLHKFGEPIHDFIDRRFNLVTLAFTILLIGGFLVLRFVGH